jgi:hypothetical protein
VISARRVTGGSITTLCTVEADRDFGKRKPMADKLCIGGESNGGGAGPSSCYSKLHVIVNEKSEEADDGM